MRPCYYANNYFNQRLNSYYQIPPCMRSTQSYDMPPGTPEASMPYASPMTDMSPASPVNIQVPTSWNFGPLTIEWTFSGESLNVVFKIVEEAVQDILLTLSKPSVTFSLALGNATIKMTVSADFTKGQLTISGSICADTTCTTFNNTVVATW